MSDLSVASADMQIEINRGALDQFWRALIEARAEEALQVYADHAVLCFPQTEEMFVGRTNIGARGLLNPGEKLVKVNRIVGEGGLWVSECETARHSQTAMLVSVLEMDDGRIIREARYRCPKRASSSAAVGSPSGF